MFNQNTISSLQSLISDAEKLERGLRQIIHRENDDESDAQEQLFRREAQACGLRDSLGGTLILGTVAAYVIFAEKNPNPVGQRYCLTAFAVSKVLPRTFGELLADDEGVNFVFQVAEKNNDVIMTSPEGKTVHLTVDDERGWEEDGGSVIAAFSSPEKLDDWCQRRFREKAVCRPSKSDRGQPQNLTHQWW